jgi:hypothetical protein
MKLPISGFADPAIATMFNPPAPTSSQTELNTTDQASLPPSQAARNANISAIAGGVIGAVLSTFLFLGLAIYLKRRHSGSGIRESMSQSTFTYDPKELPGEEIYAKEMKGDIPSHELQADVPEMEPAELESPKTVHEKDSTPIESPVLPGREFLGGDETTPEESPGLEQGVFLGHRGA